MPARAAVRSRTLCLLALAALAGCSREPAAQRLLRAGNKYLEQGKAAEASIVFRQAIEKDRRFGAAYLQLARAELRLARIRPAMGAFRRACELRASGDEACLALADLLLTTYLRDPLAYGGLVAELDDIAAGILRRDPSSYDGHRIRGYVHAGEGRDEEAEKSFATANRIRPNQSGVVVVLARFLARRDFPQAEKMLLDLIEHDKSFSPAYDLLYMEYLRAKRLPDADRMIELKAAQNPSNPGFQLQVANHYRASRRPDKMQEALQRLATDRKRFPDGRLRAGAFYHAIGDFSSAAREFRLGMEDQPARKAEYQKRLVEALYSQGLRGDAVELANQLAAENPRDPESKGLRAILRMRAGNAEDVRQSVADLAEAVRSRPDSLGMRIRLAEAYFATGDLDSAATHFAEASRQRPDLIAPQLGLTQALIAKGEYGKALAVSEAILGSIPTLAEARFQRARALIGMGEKAKGRAELDLLKREHSNLPAPVDALARADMAEGRFREAEAGFRALIGMGSHFAGVRGLVDTRIAEGKTAEAANIAREELAKSPQSPLLRLLYADASKAAGNSEAAIEEYEYLQGRFPLDARLHFQTGEARIQLGRLHEAADAFEKACVLAPNDAASHKRLAMVYAALGNLPKARDAYRSAVRLAPDDATSLNNLAYILAELNEDLNAALQHANRARQRRNDSLDIEDTLGWVYTRRGLWPQAIAIYEKLLRQAPNNPLYRYHYAAALSGKGDKAGALRELGTALSLKPNKDEERRIRAMLGSVR